MKRLILILTLLFTLNLFADYSFVSAKDSNGITYYKAGFPGAAKSLLMQELASSSDAEVCYYLGNIYFDENKPDSAAWYYNKGLSQDAENAYCRIGLAQLQMKSDMKAAAELIDAALKGKNKKNADILIAAGRAFLANNKMTEATSYLEQAKKVNSKYAPALVFGGDIAYAEKKIGEACSQYEQAIYFDPACTEAYIKYARAYAGVSPQLSVEMLHKLKEQQPEFTPVEKELASIHYSAGEYRKAIGAYEKFVNSSYASADDLTRYGMVLFLAKDYQKSLDVVTKGLNKDPENVVLKRLAMYDNFELKNYEQGALAAEKFFGQTETPDAVYLDYLYYGRLLNALRKSDQAIAHYEKALKMEAGKPEIWKELSETYEKLNNYDEAINSFNKYIKATGKEADTSDLFLLGRLYYFAGNALEAIPENLEKKNSVLMTADSIFAVVAQKVPDNYLGNFWRARVNSVLDPETTEGLAKPYYEAALAILETKPDANKSILVECNSYLGYYYFVKNDFTQSKVYWNKILELDPTNETAQKALEGIK